MTTLNHILTVLRRMAPEETALPRDPVGLLIGSEQPGAEVRTVGVCLDATPEAVQRAADAGAGLVVAHHPLIYHPLQRLDAASDPIARAVTGLIKADIALYAMHTNWDRAEGGVNDTLAALLGLENVRRLGEHGEEALVRLGELTAPLPLAEFLARVESALACKGTNALRVSAPAAGGTISQVAVCGGAGASLAGAARSAGADAYVTSDVRHHEFLDAVGRGLALIDAGHDATETPGMHALARRLAAEMPTVGVVWVGP